MKKKTFTILVLSLIMTIISVVISNRVAYANSNELNAYEDYISYYQDSDEIYDMSDRDNIKPLNYSIRDFESFLYASKLEYLENEQKINVNGIDPITNIIPIEFFYNEMENVFVGKEYIFFINTEEIKELNEVVAYRSHVAVIDINDNIKNNVITNSYVELSLNRLFEYNYVTILKSKNYVLPYWELNMSILNKMVLSNNIDDDYVIIPLVDISYARIEKNQFPAVKVSNINMLSTFMNSNDYNEYDNNYNMMTDDGYFFTGMTVDYYATRVTVGSNSKCGLFIKTIADIIGLLPMGNGIVNGIKGLVYNGYDSYGLACDILGLFSNAPVTYTPVTSENDYVSKTDLLYTERIDQINYYGHLMKNYFSEYTGPALLNKNDHVNTRFQYSYTEKNKSTRINEIINFDLSYGNREYEILYENTKDINPKETNISLNEIIKDEYNEYSCESIYNYVSQTNQELDICCGNNDVMIYEDNILVSTNKRYSFIKNKSYKIVVINRSEVKEGLLYNFYFKGYSINDIINLDSNESVLYTFESNEDIIRYVDSNANINQLELIKFKENEIYQFIVTNDDSNKDIYLEIKDIEEAIIDEDGHILNDAKFAKLKNNESTIWMIEYLGDSAYYYLKNEDLYKSISNYAFYKDIYVEVQNIDSIAICELEFNAYYNQLLIDDDFRYISFNDTGNIAYDYEDLDGEIQIYLSNIFVSYDGDYYNFEDQSNVNNRLSFDRGYGKYYALVIFNAVSYDGLEYTSISINKSLLIYYVPNYSNIEFYSHEVTNDNLNTYISTVMIKISGFYEYIDFNVICPKYLDKVDNIIVFQCIYENSTYIENIWDFRMVLINDNYYDYYPSIATNIINNSPLLFKNFDVFKIRTSQFDYVYDNNSMTYLITNYYQLKLALTYSDYGYIQYDDGINYDVEIYGYTNSYNFKIINDINCLNQTIEINKGILFDGTFDGGGHTISNLIIKIIKNDDFSKSRYRGVFESNYGTIGYIKFDHVIYDFTEYKEDKNKIFGFITPGNYGIMYGINYSECYYRYLYYSKPLIGKGKWVTKAKMVTETNQYEF